MRKRIMILCAAAVCLLALTACTGGRGDSAGQDAGKVKTIDYNALMQGLPENESPSFADFGTIDMDGEVVTQEIFADYDLTMINIWATFCNPCIDEMPELGRISQNYRDSGVQVLGIAADTLDQKGFVSAEQTALAQIIISKTGAAYRHLLPSEDLYHAKLNAVSTVPETIFVDKNGNQVGESYLGARDEESWSKIIDKLLAEVKE